jgi:ubiquitin-protein ligase
MSILDINFSILLKFKNRFIIFYLNQFFELGTFTIETGKYTNRNDSVLIGIHVPEDSKTGSEYECSNEENKGENPYAGGHFLVEVFFDKLYPNSPPIVMFKTKIIHANVSSKDGYICLDAFTRWK